MESQTSWRKQRWCSTRRRWRRMWRRRSGYGHTAVQQIIIGFVRQHLLCQHSSRQPRGGRAAKRPQSLWETDRNKARHRKAEPASALDALEFTFMFMRAQSEPSARGGQKFKSTSARLQRPWPRRTPLGLTVTSDLLLASQGVSRCLSYGVFPRPTHLNSRFRT